MGRRERIYFSDRQKAEIWDRWQRGESMRSIGRQFDRSSSSIFPLLSRTGGIRPPERKRSRRALTLFEREEISRGLRAHLSLRAIARQLCRPLRRSAAKCVATVAGLDIAPRYPIRRPGIVLCVPSHASWLACVPYAGQYPVGFSAIGHLSRSLDG